MPTFELGDKVPSLRLRTIDSARVYVPDRHHLVHLQFRRFAGCPICHLHIRSIAQHISEIEAAGIVEVVVFHSDIQALQKYQPNLPFAVIADPDHELYSEFGVQSSLGSIAHPRAWMAAARGTVRQRSLKAGIGVGEDHLGKPADFLIAPDGKVLAVKYGTHADDQWSAETIVDLGSRYRTYARPPRRRGK